MDTLTLQCFEVDPSFPAVQAMLNFAAPIDRAEFPQPQMGRSWGQGEWEDMSEELGLEYPSVLGLSGIELIFFPVADIVFCSGF